MSNPAWAKTSKPRDLSYSDGSTGALVSTGSTSVAATSYTTLTASTGTFNEACFHTYALTSITVTSTLSTTPGNAAVTTTGGVLVAAGSLPGTVAGQNSSTSASGSTTGTNATGLTGTGGGGGTQAGSNKAAGTLTTTYTHSSEGFLAGALNAVTNPCQFPFGTASAGGRGDGSGVSNGGASGSAGGSMFYATPTWAGAGTISGIGGNGSAGTVGVLDGGGGGGGGSGCLLVGDNATGIAPTLTGGTGGSGGLTGGAGGSGTTPTSQKLVSV